MNSVRSEIRPHDVNIQFGLKFYRISVRSEIRSHDRNSVQFETWLYDGNSVWLEIGFRV